MRDAFGSRKVTSDNSDLLLAHASVWAYYFNITSTAEANKMVLRLSSVVLFSSCRLVCFALSPGKRNKLIKCEHKADVMSWNVRICVKATTAIHQAHRANTHANKQRNKHKQANNRMHNTETKGFCWKGNKDRKTEKNQNRNQTSYLSLFFCLIYHFKYSPFN